MTRKSNKMMGRDKVQIIVGSKDDLPIVQKAREVLERLQIDYYLNIASAHRTPQRVAELVWGLAERGVGVVIACAGMSAHLAGVIAAQTTLPVIGVPIDSSSLSGIDALLATVQMPGGIPVACMGIGEAGAKNGALLAAEILALSDEGLSERLKKYRQDIANRVLEDDKNIDRKLRRT
jgi:phosphoribosylaminoimidazole carboxylase PurE protein